MEVKSSTCQIATFARCDIATLLHLESPNETGFPSFIDRCTQPKSPGAMFAGPVQTKTAAATSRSDFSENEAKKTRPEGYHGLTGWKFTGAGDSLKVEVPWSSQVWWYPLCDVGFHTWQTDVVYLALAQCEASWVFGGHKIDTKMWRASSSHSKLKFLDFDHELKIQQDNLAQFPAKHLANSHRSHNLSSQHLLELLAKN